MSYFTSGALASGNSFEANVDDVWAITTLAGVWSNPSDTTAAASVFFSADEGANWFLVAGMNYGGPAYVVLNNLPTNAVKIEVTAAAAGNTLTAAFTGK